MVRVRYAPSPTGTLHIGGARTALFNYLYARRHNGRFILRVEDTDETRQIPGSEALMMAGLKSLGLEWDEGPDMEDNSRYGPYRVSERLVRHRALADQLLASHRAYRCFCSPEQLAIDRKALRAKNLAPRYSGRCRSLTEDEVRARAGERSVVRLIVPQEGMCTVHDVIRGDVEFDNRVFDDFVIMKPDYTPVYNFAVTIDDHDMEITHVIRGEEHLSNTPKQLFVMAALGWDDVPTFAHLPMILAPDKSKISKRHGATAVEEYRDQGILLAALANYLLMLGWSTPDGREILTIDEAAQEFSLERVQHTGAIYDQKKLEWFSHQYMTHLPIAEIARLVRPFIYYRVDEGPSYEAVVSLCRERAYTLVQLADQMAFFYHPPEHYDAKGVAKYFTALTAQRLDCVRNELQGLSHWDREALMQAYDRLSEALGVKRAELIHPTRLSVTGRTVGPGLFELLELLGSAEVLSRLQTTAERIRSGNLVTQD